MNKWRRLVGQLRPEREWIPLDKPFRQSSNNEQIDMETIRRPDETVVPAPPKSHHCGGQYPPHAFTSQSQLMINALHLIHTRGMMRSLAVIRWHTYLAMRISVPDYWILTVYQRSSKESP